MRMKDWRQYRPRLSDLQSAKVRAEYARMVRDYRAIALSRAEVDHDALLAVERARTALSIRAYRG